MADTYGMKFIETSAKNASNVEEAFMTMTREIVSLKKKSKEADEKKPVIKINNTKNLESKTGGCCGKSG